MSIQIRLPGIMRRFADGCANVDVEATTVGQALREMTTRFPRLHEHVFAPDGEVRSFVNVYVNSHDVRYLQRNDTAVKPSDVIALLPAISGG
jgi:sulfur-carrier protein